MTADLHQTQAEQADIEDLLVRIQALDHETAPPPDEAPAAPEGDPATVAAVAPNDAPAVAPPITPESDDYEEEHDEELFGIFLEQLQEGLEALQSWTDALPGADRSDRIELLGRCLEQIDPLRSSANYMGYGKLTILYDDWNNALLAARDDLDRGDDHFMDTFIHDEMQPRIDQIKGTFPRLTIADPAPHGLDTPSDDDPYDFIETDPEDFTDAAIRGDSDADSFLENMDMAVPSPVEDDRPPAELNLFPQGHVEAEEAPPASTNGNALDLPLLQDFIAETVEHLEEMEGNLLRLETDPGNRETLNDIFRSVHTIKGASEYLGMERIAELSHKLENLLDLMRHNAQSASREVLDLLMAAPGPDRHFDCRPASDPGGASGYRGSSGPHPGPGS